jgi:hypothetical protein
MVRYSIGDPTMTVTLNLSPEQEEQLRREAGARGVEPPELLRQLVRDALAGLAGTAPPGLRVPGLHAGHTRIADDFDAPLPESFWTGSE